MKDFSILIIKPEAIENKEKIIISLNKRGYKIILKKEFTNWRNTMAKIYKEFSSEEIETYIKGYDQHKFGDKFIILLLTHKKGNTLQRLKEEKGNFINYQKKKENSLRGEFGLPEKYNTKYRGITFVYCGVHCPENEEELELQLKMFDISLSE